MGLGVQFVCLLLISYSCARSLKIQEWDHFIFTLEWPQSLCWELNFNDDDKCTLPHETNFWTIHGLWPTYKNTHGPSCCTEDKFDAGLISSIEEDLFVRWANLLPNTGKYSFWKHEWEKHGTCAMSMGELNSQFKYFTKTLELHKTYDITKLLAKAGIEPSDTESYQRDQLAEAFESVLGGKARIMCYSPKSEPAQYLAQVEFCLDTSFGIIDCPHHKQSAEQPTSDFDTIERVTGQRRVWKMEIPNRDKNFVPIVTKPAEMPNRHKMSLNDCTGLKDIMYPIINHN